MSDLEDSVDAYLDLRDQLEEAEAARDYFRGAFKSMSEHAGMLREALAWYADEAHYYNTGTETAMDDKGQRARRTLKRKEDGLNVR